jgi:hypothetical protein
MDECETRVIQRTVDRLRVADVSASCELQAPSDEIIGS